MFSLILEFIFKFCLNKVIFKKDSKNERKKLEKGANILVCTPGKLLHHLETTADLQKRNLQYFVVSWYLTI